METPTTQAEEKKQKTPHTPAEQDKFCKMAEDGGKKYIRIDPKTKQHFSEAKEFFWSILSWTNECIGFSESEVRINFLIQKYYRDPAKMYKVQEMANGSTVDVKKHRAFSDVRPNGELKAPGDRMIDASDFLVQFQAE